MKKNSFTYTIILLFISLCGNAQLNKNETTIQGEIKIDTTKWESTAYLSYIPTFDYMSVISYDMIVSATEIDSSGFFKFDTSFLPEDNLLYRIHIPKKNTSPISLIIGGKEENHLFLIAKSTSQINIRVKNSESLFRKVFFSDDIINSDFHNVISIVKSEDDIDFDATLMQRRLIKENIAKDLKTIAKESQNPLVALYALYKSDIDDSNKEGQQFIKVFNDKWYSENSQYFNAYRSDSAIESTNDYNSAYIAIGILVLLIVLYTSTSFIKKRRGATSKKQLQSLSIQERKILGLIQKGLSNKEISETCHIELSTTKTHVSNIYSKLNVKSRKEAIEVTS